MSTYQDEVLQQLKAQTGLMAMMKATLDAMANDNAPASPNYRRQLAEYPNFDWQAIGATVSQSDDHGASEVEWRGHRFTRRSGSGKYGEAIWFSRPTGSDDNGGTSYARLITFKDNDAEPLQVSVPAQAAPRPKPQPQAAKVQRPKRQPRQQPQPPQQAAPLGQVPAELKQAARQVENTASNFWEFVNLLLKNGYTVGQDILRPIVNDAATGWDEKALALVGA